MIRRQKLATDLAFVSPTQLIATEKTLRLFDASIRALLHESAPLESDYRILAVAPQVGTLFAATMNRVVSADADDVRTPSLFYESPPATRPDRSPSIAPAPVWHSSSTTRTEGSIASS